MNQKEIQLKKHLFICTNKRTDGRSFCAEKGSEGLQKELKDWVKSNPDLRKDTKISKSGCLGFCEMGIAAVLYPEQKWLTDIKKEDIEEIKNLLKKE